MFANFGPCHVRFSFVYTYYEAFHIWFYVINEMEYSTSRNFWFASHWKSLHDLPFVSSPKRFSNAFSMRLILAFFRLHCIRLIIYWILRTENYNCFRLIYSNTSIKCNKSIYGQQFKYLTLNLSLKNQSYAILFDQLAGPVDEYGCRVFVCARIHYTRSVSIRSQVNKHWAHVSMFKQACSFNFDICDIKQECFFSKANEI